MRLAPLLLVGCISEPPSDLQSPVLTDGGSWTVRVDMPPEGAGLASLPVSIEPADGALASLVASMPNMGHASDGVVEDQGDGAFLVEVDFTMAGWWVLDGEVAGASGVEGFRMELEVP